MDALNFFGFAIALVVGFGLGLITMYVAGLIIDRMVDNGYIPDGVDKEDVV